MTQTETTTESYGKRVGNAFKGVIAGFFVVLIAVVLLFWNEGRTVNRHKVLQEGMSQVVPVGSGKVNPENEGKLIHVTGSIATSSTLTDPDFPVSVQGVRLQRRVKTYQWEEKSTSTTKKNVGGDTVTNTTNSYKKIWSPLPIDSSDFKTPGHENKVVYPYESKDFIADYVTLGDFILSVSLIKAIGPEVDFIIQKPEEAKNAKKAEPVKAEPVKSDSSKVTPQKTEVKEPPKAESKDSQKKEVTSTDRLEAKNNPIKQVAWLTEKESTPATTSKTDVAKPAEAKPAEAKPADAKPAEAKPVDAKPVDAKPAETKPAETKSVETKSVETKSVTAEKTKEPVPTPENNDTDKVSSNTTATPNYKIINGGFYFGANPEAPEIGDVQISYSYVPSVDKSVSIISQQHGKSFAPYRTEKGTLELLDNGVYTPTRMLRKAQNDNRTIAWLTRGAGLFLIFIGFNLMLQPLSVMFDVVPVIGSIVGFGTSFFSFLLALVTSLIVIAIAWLYYRPFVGITLVVIALVLLLVILCRRKKVKVEDKPKVEDSPQS